MTAGPGPSTREAKAPFWVWQQGYRDGHPYGYWALVTLPDLSNFRGTRTGPGP
jgi:hypothetical protein